MNGAIWAVMFSLIRSLVYFLLITLSPVAHANDSCSSTDFGLAVYGLQPHFTQIPVTTAAYPATSHPLHVSWKLKSMQEKDAPPEISFDVRAVDMIILAPTLEVLHTQTVWTAANFFQFHVPSHLIYNNTAPRRLFYKIRALTYCWGPFSALADLYLGPGKTGLEWYAADWICTSNASIDSRSTLLRGEFSIPPTGPLVTEALLNIIGLGQFSVSLNGVSVMGGDANVPGWTTWNKRLLYSTYPLNVSLLSPGLNVLGVTLGNGMFNVPGNISGRYTKWVGSFGPRMALVLLTLRFTDNTTLQIASTTADGNWMATDDGPIVFTHQYAGEDYDASRAMKGWDEPGFDPTANPLVTWSRANNCTSWAPNGTLTPSDFEPVRVMETLTMLSVVPSTGDPNVLIVDVGRNFAGYAVVTLENVPLQSTIRLTPSETLIHGAIDQSSGGSPAYWQYFTSAQPEQFVTITPTFFTYGWRWLAVEIIVNRPFFPEGHGLVTILEAKYGENCGVDDLVTNVLAAVCDGLTDCVFLVQVCPGVKTGPCLPDPAPNCAKTFYVFWSCSLDPVGSNRSVFIAPEANMHVVNITCGPMPPTPPRPNLVSAFGCFTRASLSRVGAWSSSNAWVNRIHNITVEAFEANLQSILTDCPHRERLGWLEVSHLAFPALAYNFDLARLFSKIAFDTVDSQLSNGLVPDIAPEFTIFSGGFRDSPGRKLHIVESIDI